MDESQQNNQPPVTGELNAREFAAREAIPSQESSEPGIGPATEPNSTEDAAAGKPPPESIPQRHDINNISYEEWVEMAGLPAAADDLEPEYRDMEDFYSRPEPQALSLAPESLHADGAATTQEVSTRMPGQSLRPSDRVRWNKDKNQPELAGQIPAGDAPGLAQAGDLPSREELAAIASDHPGPAFGSTEVGYGGWLIKSTTAKLYEKHANSLWWAAARSFSQDPEEQHLMKPTYVAAHLIRKVKGHRGKRPLRKATWHAYRSSLLWFFGPRAQDPDYAEAIRILEEFTYPEETASEGDDDNGSSKGKRKGIPIRDLQKIIDQLSLARSSIALNLQCWLIAGIHTGLRPGEWEHAAWANEDRSILLAPNSKQHADTFVSLRTTPTKALEAVEDVMPLESVSPGSPNVDSRAQSDRSQPNASPPNRLGMRAIPIDAAMRFWVGAHMDLVQEAKASGVSFEHYYGLARKTLWRICKQIWGDEKAYSLYQCRHQFSANYKAVLNLDEVADRMGHSDPRISHRHYASARESHFKKVGRPSRKQSTGQVPAIVQALRAGLHKAQASGEGGDAESSAESPRPSSS